MENTLSLATPFLAFLPAEELHVSGVLAVVICRLVLGHHGPGILSSACEESMRTLERELDLEEGLLPVTDL